MKITGITHRVTRTNQKSSNQKNLNEPLLQGAQIEPNTTSSLEKPSRLSKIPALHCKYLIATNNIHKSVQLIKTGTPNEKEQAAYALGYLAFKNTQNQTAIAQAGAIPALVNLLNSGTDKGKAYAAFALGNLAANNPKNQNAIAQADAIPALVTLLNSGTDKGKAYAATALGNLANNNTQIQNAIAQAGAIPALVTLLNSGTDREKVYAAYAAAALDNLANNNTQIQNAIAQADAIPALATLLIYGTRMQKEHAANALGTLAHNTQNQGSIQALGFLVYGRDRANSFADMALNKVKFSGTADVSLLLAHLLFDQTAIGDHLRKNFYQDKFQVKLRDECKKLDPNILLFDQITIGEFLSTGRLIQRV